MARIRPGGGNDGAPQQGGRHKHHKRSHPRGRHPRAKHPRAKHPRQHKPSAPHSPAPEPVSARSAWPQTTHAPGAISPLIALDPSVAPAPDPLTLTGAERGPIHATLTAWTHQRDQTLNRIMRRPGGLTHLAGL
jgi:hypothetical protein